uniref:AF4/FMR2 family, member 2 n=1 Tax=Poecilia formosa TaxID=48698 RepID=A0A087XFA4_POEFO
SGASGSSSESESSSESDTDESESSSSDSDYNQASRTNTPEPEPPSTNKWQLDSWLNKVQAQTKPLVPTQQEHHGAGSISQDPQTFSPRNEAPERNASRPLSKVSVEFSPGREKAKAKLGQKAAGEGQRSKMRLSPGLLSGQEVPAPRRNTTGKKQPRRAERSSSVEENQNQAWSRTNQHSPAAREKDLLPPPPLEHQNPPRPRGKPLSGKTAPRKEPRSATSLDKDKRKHRGPSTKITPKSREFIETDSSSSSSECQSDGEEATKIPSMPAPSISAQMLATVHSNGNLLSIGNISASFGNSVPDPGGQGKDAEPASPPSNVGHDVALSPLRDYHEVQSLWVKIDLSFLSRVPEQTAGERARLAGRTERLENGGKHRRQAAANMVAPTEKHTSKSKRKHKLDHGESPVKCNKKLRLDKDCLLLPPCISPIHNHKSSSAEENEEKTINHAKKQTRRRDDKLLPPLLSPLSDEPPRKRACDGGPSLTEEAGAVGMLPCSASSAAAAASSHRHRRGEGKATAHARNGGVSVLLEPSIICFPGQGTERRLVRSTYLLLLVLRKNKEKTINHANNIQNDSYDMDSHCDKPGGDGYHANGHSDSEVWSEAMMGQSEPRRPRLSFTDTVHTAEYYMQEAKRLKHKADALTDKFGKAVNYADGALSFIECGNAMERDPLEAKSPYTMYSETVELIRYAMRLKNFTSHSATVLEKRLAVLCNRCLSLLYLRMFHLKKDHAVKYSRSLMEYFKVIQNSAKSSHQAPSPWRSNGKVNGTPSPLSLSPSPASSGGAPAAATGGGGTSGSSGSVAIPQRIHHMAASHVNITNNILRSYEQWETADRLAADSRDFFQDLDSALSQQSSMVELVRYIRQGLHWLRSEAQLL